MKILFVINSLGAGGAERVISRLADELMRRGNDTVVLTFDRHEAFAPLTSRRIALGISAERPSILGTLLKFPKLLLAVRRAVISEAPDVVLSFMDQNNIVTLLATRGLKVPVVVSERVAPERSSLSELPLPLRQIGLTLRKLLYRSAALVVLQTNTAARYFKNLNANRVAVIPNAVPEPSLVSAPTPLKVKRPFVLSLGRLVSQKRVDLTIDAFAEIGARISEWSLVIAGDGALRSELETRAARKGIADRVTFLGLVQDPYSLLAQADILVLASDYEGFPGALTEAMSTGVCCIATRCPYGPEEIIQDGTNGILIPVGDKAALTKELETAINNSVLRKKLGDEARKVCSRFSESSVLDSWEQVLKTSALTFRR